MLITIKRKGDFTVTASSPNQCGHEGKGDYKYRVEITGTSLRLDGQGFLIDNKYIDAYFQNFNIADSCENMVSNAAQGLWDICKRHGTKPKRIVVEIFGSEFSSCEAILM